jgi:hypothetical protein
MGFNATVVVLLDRMFEIEKDPDFGKKLCDAIRFRSSFPKDVPGLTRYGSAEATGQTQVIEVHHADNMVVVAVGGNTGKVLGYGGGYSSDDDEIVKDLVRNRKFAKKYSAPPKLK